MYDYKISFSANAVCTHSTQVIIKSPTQIIKWYLKLKSSRMYSLQSTIVVDACVDEFLKYLHCYSHHCCHRRPRRRHHSALCTVDHFYLLVRLRLTHHLINCCPKCLDAPTIAMKRMNERKRREQIYEWNGMKCSRVLEHESRIYFIADSNSKNKKRITHIHIFIVRPERWNRKICWKVVNAKFSSARRQRYTGNSSFQFQHPHDVDSGGMARIHIHWTLEECFGSAISRRQVQKQSKIFWKSSTFCFIIISIQTRTKSYTNAMNKMPF